MSKRIFWRQETLNVFEAQEAGNSAGSGKGNRRGGIPHHRAGVWHTARRIQQAGIETAG
jgi:hypothetical protein